MSFFSWLLGKPAKQTRRGIKPQGDLKVGAVPHPAVVGRSLPRPDSTPSPVTAPSRNERMERREALYRVVRDAMVRAGVLSASYKFKVLALDPRGLQFLVMMDLAREYGSEAVRLSEIESLIAQTAKTRHEITVTAVYWRINDQIAAHIPQKGVAPQGAALPLSPTAPAHPVATAAPVAPARPAAAAPGPIKHETAAHAPAAAAVLKPASENPVRLVSPRFDPIEADEVAAFKQALATAAAARTPVAAAPGVPVRSGARHGAPQGSDFADTEMPSQDSRSQSLSSTQYGDL